MSSLHMIARQARGRIQQPPAADICRFGTQPDEVSVLPAIDAHLVPMPTNEGTQPQQVRDISK